MTEGARRFFAALRMTEEAMGRKRKGCECRPGHTESGETGGWSSEGVADGPVGEPGVEGGAEVLVAVADFGVVGYVAHEVGEFGDEGADVFGFDAVEEGGEGVEADTRFGQKSETEFISVFAEALFLVGGQSDLDFEGQDRALAAFVEPVLEPDGEMLPQLAHGRVEHAGGDVAVALVAGAQLEDLPQVVQRDDKAAAVAPLLSPKWKSETGISSILVSGLPVRVARGGRSASGMRPLPTVRPTTFWEKCSLDQLLRWGFILSFAAICTKKSRPAA